MLAEMLEMLGPDAGAIEMLASNASFEISGANASKAALASPSFCTSPS